MQRKRSSPAQRRLWSVLLVIALLILFFAAVGASCSANPHLYGGRGCVIFLPANASASSVVLTPF